MPSRFPLIPAAVIAAATAMAAGVQPALAAAASPVSVPCSTTALASAMTSAASGETIRLAAGCDYVLTAALPPVSASLTIQGRGATLERSTAPGTPEFAILTVNTADLSVSNLTFSNGYGGAIDMNETTDQNPSPTNSITVTHATFTGNTGGAINLGGELHRAGDRDDHPLGFHGQHWQRDQRQRVHAGSERQYLRRQHGRRDHHGSGECRP